MEVEIASQPLDCSRYGSAAVVANDSHFVLLALEIRTPNKGAHLIAIISYATRHEAARNANILNDSNEVKIEQDCLRQSEQSKHVKMMKGPSRARSE